MTIRFIQTLVIPVVLVITLSLFSSCVTVEKIRTGEQAMDRKQYAVAQSLLVDEIAKSQGLAKAEKCFLLGEAYRLTNQPVEAVEWYLNAESFGWDTDELYWRTAMMLKQNGDYQRAISYLQKIQSNSAVGTDARRELDICRQAQQWIKRDNSGFTARTIQGNYQGSIYINGLYEDGRFVVTSDHQQNQNPRFKWTGRHYADNYLMRIPFDGILERLPGWESEKYQRGSATFNSDYSEMIFTRCDQGNPNENFCQLYSARKINGEWREIQPLNFIQPGVNYGHPWLSRDSILFFSANSNAGKGAYDIYFSIKKGQYWQKPINLPAPINTPGNEKFPTVNEDTLYYSSDYLPGLGGLDIFKTYVLPDGRWSPPQNLMPPINSSVDDFGLIFTGMQDPEPLGYFNSTRNNNMGLDRIFAVLKRKGSPVETIQKDTLPLIESKNFSRFLSLRVVEYVFEDPTNPNSRVIGKKPIENALGVFQKTQTKFTTRGDGRFIGEIAFDTSYTIQIAKTGYLQRSVSIPSASVPRDPEASEIQTTSIEVVLQKPYVDQEIVLNNIYYDLDEWYIREDAKPTLDQLSQDLKDNPGYDVLIAAHTDCRADEAYNLILSERRAKSVVDYLVEKGIDPARLSFQGYGKSRLIEKCPCESCTEKQHQKNRRTTFTLLK